MLNLSREKMRLQDKSVNIAERNPPCPLQDESVGPPSQLQDESVGQPSPMPDQSVGQPRPVKVQSVGEPSPVQNSLLILLNVVHQVRC